MWLNRSVFAFVISFCIYALPNSLDAQSRINSSGNGGVHTIQGRIYTPNGKMVENAISVRLENRTFGDLTLMTDLNGGFAFTSLLPGNYTVVVDAGTDFEIARESITIDPQIQGSSPSRDQPRVFTVPVNLRLKRNVVEKPGVVNAKLSEVPTDALKHYEKGKVLSQAGKSDEAITEFNQAISIYPNLAPAYVAIGKIYLTSGRFDDAIDSLRKAIRLDPQDFDAKLDYGIALYGKGDYEDAEPALRSVAEMNKTAITPHYYLGLLYIQRKNLDFAQTELEAAKQLNGDRNFPLLHRYLGGIYLAKKLNKLAIAELETYITLAPTAKDADRIRQTILDLRNKTN